MVASLETIRRVADLVRKYVRESDMEEFLRELEGIPGNQSFRETVSELCRDIRIRGRVRKL